MGLFSKRQAEHPLLSAETEARIRIRAKTLDEESRIRWIEQCLYSIGSEITKFSSTRDAVHLEEAKMAAGAISILLQDFDRQGFPYV